MNIRKIAVIGLFIGMTIIGADIRLFQSIALDALPAFLAALILGPVEGGLLGFVGHFITAFLAGLPFGLPIHLIIAIMLFLSVSLFGKVFRMIKPRPLAYILSILVGYSMNVVISLAVLYPFLGKMVYTLFIPLSLASLFNILAATLIYSIIYNRV